MARKITILFLYILLGQYMYGQCSNCEDSSNTISYNGDGTFSAANAQAYYWEICSGEASIPESNIGKDVSVVCLANGNFKLKLVRFLNGNCVEACKSYTCANGMIVEGGGGDGDDGDEGANPGSMGSCPAIDDITFANEGGNGLCSTGMASIPNLENVDYIEWSWALGGYSGTFQAQGNSAAIYYPQNDWTNYYIAICATVTFEDGTTCVKKCKSFLLNCGDAQEGSFSKVKIYPNPTKNKISIKTSEMHPKITQIEVSNFYGLIVQSITSNFGSHLDLSNESEGMYLVRISYADGSVETKKVLVNK